MTNPQTPDLSVYNDEFLAKTQDARIAYTGCGTLEAYNALLNHDTAELAAFSAALHVTDSRFFRNPLTFAVLEQLVIQQLVRKVVEEHRREIRIWSAGCAAGQEPYSIAILLEELQDNSRKSFDYRIFATDMSEEQIDFARKGRFSAETLGNIGLKRVNQWFVRKGREYIIDPTLKTRIEFSVDDLFGPANSPPASIFGDFDLVLCCNLLFYYKPDLQQSILEKLGQCLRCGAFIVTGETEHEIVKNFGYREIVPGSGVFWYKA